VRLDGSYLHLAVSDTGCGIAPEIMNRIFDPYFSTKGTGEGTGLGLSIVHGIVTGYKGFISVDSHPGFGSTFNIYLPVHNPIKKAKREARPANIPFMEATILMVDDEPALADIFNQALTKAGYVVQTYSDATQALNEFESHPDKYDLVVSDITMPQMDGIQLATSIKSLRDIPVILYTGFCDHGIQQRAETAGIKHVLGKPILPNDLIKAVRHVIHKHYKSKKTKTT